MNNLLTGSAIEAIFRGDTVTSPVLQLLACKKMNAASGGKAVDRYRLLLSDGIHTCTAMLATQRNEMVVNGELDVKAAIRLKDFSCNRIANDRRVIVVLNLDVVKKGSEIGMNIGNPTPMNTPGQAAAKPAPDQGQQKPDSTVAYQQQQGAKPTSYGSGAPPSRSPMTNGGSKQGSFYGQPNGSMGGSNVSPKKVQPISSLTPYQNRWTIKVRVNNKTAIRTWSNARGEGKLFSMDLGDQSGEIRCTAFKEMVDKFYDMIEIGKVYYISRGTLKPANRQYTSINNDYELTFNNDTQMEPCMEEDGSIPAIHFDFRSISQLEETPEDSMIDVIGVCKSVSDIQSITIKSSNREVNKRSLQLVDDSQKEVALTLWGKEAEEFDGTANPVVAVKGARLSGFGGRSLSVLQSSIFQINPDIPRAHHLKGWFDSEGYSQESQSISTRQGSGGGGSNTNWLTFHDVHAKNLGQGEKPDYFTVKGTILFVRKENCMYMACPSTECNKKVSENGDGSYRCEKCAKDYPGFKYRLLLSVVDDLLKPSTSGEPASATATESDSISTDPSVPTIHVPAVLSCLSTSGIQCSRTTPMQEAIQNSKAHAQVTPSSVHRSTSFSAQGLAKDGTDRAFQNPLDVLYPVQSSQDTPAHPPLQTVPLNKILLSLRKSRTENPPEEVFDQPASKHARLDGQLDDHTYCMSPRDDPPLPEASLQSPEQPRASQDDLPLPTSSPSATPPQEPTSKPSPLSSPSSSSISHSSSSATSGVKSDTSYTMSSESSSESDEEQDHLKYCTEDKYIVFDSQLDQLLYDLRCCVCSGGHITELKKNVIGTLLSVSAVCVCGNIVKRWESQPKIGQMPVGNILSTSSAFFSGGTQGSVDFFLSVLNVKNVGKTKFYDTQKRLVVKAINSAYIKNIEEVRREVCMDEELTVCGDGRCDSPGYNAKYCSYTFMHMATNKIIAMSLVQVTEATSSVAMEKLGFQRALDELLDAGLNIATVATDRHIGIRKLVRECPQYQHIDHQFDVWHMTKSVIKKLTAKSKRKETEDLGPWTRAVSNHLWWAAANCRGDEELLVEIWQSMTHHVCNVHTWNSGDKYHECAHGPLDPTKERKIKWLTPDSPAHIALQEVLFDKNLVKDIRNLTKACRTGELESFHSLLLKYAPKRQEFDYPVMLARLQLAVLDHNNNVGRAYAAKKGGTQGETQVSHSYSKRSKGWRTKDIKVKKKYAYLEDMQVHILQMQSGLVETEDVPLPDLPQNIAPVPRPPVEELLAKRFRRYKP